MYKQGMMMHIVRKIFGAGMFLMASASIAAAGQNLDGLTLMAADNCFAVGQSIASDRGVTLVAAQAAVQNGQNVCKIVVLAPATNGGRPKREIIYIPQ